MEGFWGCSHETMNNLVDCWASEQLIFGRICLDSKYWIVGGLLLLAKHFWCRLIVIITTRDKCYECFLKSHNKDGYVGQFLFFLDNRSLCNWFCLNKRCIFRAWTKSSYPFLDKRNFQKSLQTSADTSDPLTLYFHCNKIINSHVQQWVDINIVYYLSGGQKLDQNRAVCPNIKASNNKNDKKMHLHAHENFSNVIFPMHIWIYSAWHLTLPIIWLDSPNFEGHSSAFFRKKVTSWVCGGNYIH